MRIAAIAIGVILGCLSFLSWAVAASRASRGHERAADGKPARHQRKDVAKHLGLAGGEPDP